jgi:hypothetical protein
MFAPNLLAFNDLPEHINKEALYNNERKHTMLLLSLQSNPQGLAEHQGSLWPEQCTEVPGWYDEGAGPTVGYSTSCYS